jgi:magnesium-transporting ATPase (P-type)
VRLFQVRTGDTVLAIGDGANDVSMIQASMVGIGIMGLEGSQAELSSAYAIPQFKNLKRLLVVHGRYAWFRTTSCFIYTVFKNAALSLCLIFFSFYSGFSGATLFDSWLLTMFNTFFTQATPWMMGGLDMDVDDDILMESPELYKFLRTDGEYFNRRIFAMWTIDAIVTSVAVFFVCLTTMGADDLGQHSGYSLDHYGTMAFLVLLVIVDGYAFITQQIYSTVTGFVVLLNWSVIPILMFIYSAIPVDSSFNFTEVPVEVLKSKLFYIYAWVVNALVLLCLRVSFTKLFKRFWPSASEEAIKKRVDEKAKRLENEKREKELEKEKEEGK